MLSSTNKAIELFNHFINIPVSLWNLKNCVIKKMVMVAWLVGVKIKLTHSFADMQYYVVVYVAMVILSIKVSAMSHRLCEINLMRLTSVICPSFSAPRKSQLLFMLCAWLVSTLEWLSVFIILIIAFNYTYHY